MKTIGVGICFILDNIDTLSSEGDSATISFTVTGKKVDEFADRVSIRADDGSILRLSNIKRSGSGDSNTYTVTLTAQRAGLTNVSLTIYDASGSHSAQTSVTVEIPSTPTPAPTPTPEPSETPSEEPEG